MSRTILSLAAAGMIALSLSGCPQPAATPPAEETPPAEVAPEQPAEEAVSQPAPAAQVVAFPMDNTVLHDRRKALEENPALIEVENRIKVNDPITAISKSYFTIASQVQMAALQSTLNAYKAYHDKNPPFEEFKTMYTQAGAELAGLYRWQIYAYDDQTGELCILEDREAKRKAYEEKGLKLEE